MARVWGDSFYLQGRVLKTFPVSAANMELDVSSLPTGIYAVKYSDGICNRSLKLVKG